MTTTAATPGRYRFSHVARMEWAKLRSLRSTWWVLAVTVAGAIGIAVAVGVNTEDAACINIPESGRRLFISLNNGNGTFQPPFTVFAGAAPYQAEKPWSSRMGGVVTSCAASGGSASAEAPRRC